MPTPGNVEDKAEPKYEKPEDLFWDTYLKAAQHEDEARPKNWEGSMTGILTFTGLFAATVAAFIVESYTLLSPDSTDRTNALLEQLFVAMANTTSNRPVIVPPPEIFSAPPSAVLTNVLWFSSLLIALICALLATLVQEWSRAYTQDINRRQSLNDNFRTRAFNHIFIRMGVNRYGMDQSVSWIVALVHMSVFLFSCGLLVFLFPIDNIVAGITTIVLASFVLLYCAASFLPLYDKACPYKTPITYLMAFAYWLVLQNGNNGLVRWLRKGANNTKTTFNDIVARRYTGKQYEFLRNDSRSVFMREHTFSHISHARDDIFWKGLLEIIHLHQNWLSDAHWFLSYLCANETLTEELYGYMLRLYPDISIRAAIPSEVFDLVGQLSERMFALEVEHFESQITKTECTSPYLIRISGVVLRVALTKGPSQFSAQLCLARMRHSLLKLCLQASEKQMPSLKAEEYVRFLYDVNSVRFRLNGRHPSAILALLISGSYEWGWRRNNTSALVPLHNDDCCSHWASILNPENLSHVAASCMLSAITLVWKSDAMKYMAATARTLSSLTDEVPIPGPRVSDKIWVEISKISRHGRRAPSFEFVSILYSMGLEEWLEPESDFTSWPREIHTLPLFDTQCVVSLRILAQQVDFDAYFERARDKQRPSISELFQAVNTDSARITEDIQSISLPHQPQSVTPARGESIDGSQNAHVKPAQEALICSTEDVGHIDPRGGSREELVSASGAFRPEQHSSAATRIEVLGRDENGQIDDSHATDLVVVTVDQNRDSQLQDQSLNGLGAGADGILDEATHGRESSIQPLLREVAIHGASVPHESMYHENRSEAEYMVGIEEDRAEVHPVESVARQSVSGHDSEDEGRDVNMPPAEKET